MQPLDDQPNIEQTLRKPIEGACEAFRSYFHFGHVSKCLGGLLVSPQCNDTEWRVICGSARPAGLSQADRPDRAVSVIFPEA